MLRLGSAFAVVLSLLLALSLPALAAGGAGPPDDGYFSSVDAGSVEVAQLLSEEEVPIGSQVSPYAIGGGGTWPLKPIDSNFLYDSYIKPLFLSANYTYNSTFSYRDVTGQNSTASLSFYFYKNTGNDYFQIFYSIKIPVQAANPLTFAPLLINSSNKFDILYSDTAILSGANFSAVTNDFNEEFRGPIYGSCFFGTSSYVKIASGTRICIMTPFFGSFVGTYNGVVSFSPMSAPPADTSLAWMAQSLSQLVSTMGASSGDTASLLSTIITHVRNIDNTDSVISSALSGFRSEVSRNFGSLLADTSALHRIFADDDDLAAKEAGKSTEKAVLDAVTGSSSSLKVNPGDIKDVLGVSGTLKDLLKFPGSLGDLPTVFGDAFSDENVFSIFSQRFRDEVGMGSASSAASSYALPSAGDLGDPYTWHDAPVPDDWPDYREMVRELYASFGIELTEEELDKLIS